MQARTATTFRWLWSGREAFPAMLEAMDAATTSLRLEMYIFTDSPLGRRFRDALVRAAQRGVDVRVMNDAFGSFELPGNFWEPLRAARGRFRWFNPLRIGRMLYRDHRKLLICDDAVAFVGGFNVAPEYDGDGITTGWLDLGMEVRGPLAAEMAEAFDGMFQRADSAHKPLQRLRRATERNTAFADHWRLLLSGPGRGFNFLKRTLASDLAGAQDVQMICAYFLPTWRLRRELLRVARRGGRVQLVLAGKSDVLLSQLASQSLYRAFLRHRIEIYEYQPQVLHAKLFIVDGQVYVGSSNLDARSLNINYELLVRVTEPVAVREARQKFAEILPHCRRVEMKQWRASRSFWRRWLERWAYLLLARLDPYLARIRLKNLP